MNRLLTAASLAVVLILGWSVDAVADDDDDDGSGGAPITDLYAFGDSLVDTGNLFALTFGIEPPSPLYFEGRFSNGPVWVETLGPLLGLDVDFETTVDIDPLAHNQAVAGAFTDIRNSNQGFFPHLAGTGILGQVARFEAAGGEIGRNDLVVIWGGANNYIFDPQSDPDQVVDDLMRAVRQLARLGARRFVLPNLPDLGSTPLGTFSSPAASAFLSAQSRAHNVALAAAAARAGRRSLEIHVLDMERVFETLLDAQTVFANVTFPCLVQQDDGSRVDVFGVCPPLGPSLDPGALGGTLFWDLIHPSTNAHALVAFLAFGTVSGATGDGSDDDD